METAKQEIAGVKQQQVPTRLEGMETNEKQNEQSFIRVPTRLEGMETYAASATQRALRQVPTRLEGMETLLSHRSTVQRR